MLHYKELARGNLIRLLAHKLRSGAFTLRSSDQRFVANVAFLWETPWLHTNSSYRINCYLWKDITYHEIIEKTLPRSAWFAPAGCQDCFKVVVRPKTLKQLFALYELQKRMNLPSKCGIETRDTVFGNYGGYFYNRGLENGLECYKKVRAEIDADPILGPDVKVLLKRACTEMEHGIGPSDKWELTRGQLDFEIKLKDHFVDDIPLCKQNQEAKDYVKLRWVERAFSVGDETALEFNGGEPLHPEYVTYHHLLDKYEQEKKEAEDKINEENKDA